MIHTSSCYGPFVSISGNMRILIYCEALACQIANHFLFPAITLEALVAYVNRVRWAAVEGALVICCRLLVRLFAQWFCICLFVCMCVCVCSVCVFVFACLLVCLKACLFVCLLIGSCVRSSVRPPARLIILLVCLVAGSGSNVDMHTKCPVDVRITCKKCIQDAPQKREPYVKCPPGKSQLRMIQDVRQICRSHVKMDTRCPTGMHITYKIAKTNPHRYTDHM